MPADALPAPGSAAARAGWRSRMARRLHERGVGATLRKAFADHVFRHSTSVVLEYRSGWSKVAAGDVRPDWLSFTVARAPADLPPLCAGMAWRRADFAAMLAAGKIGLFALRHDVVVGCVWLSLTDHHDPASREFYAVAAHEAYHYCWLIDPSVRRTNIGLPFCRFVNIALTAMTIERQFGVVDRLNRASYLIQTRFGYRECGIKVRHYVVFGSRWTRVTRYTGTLGLANSRRAG